MINGRQKYQGICLAILSQKLAAHILVNDRSNALIRALVGVVSYNGNSAAAARDNDELVVQKIQNALVLNNLLWLWGCHNTAISSTRILNKAHLRMQLFLCLHLLFIHKLANGLCGVFESRILGINLNLSHDRCNVPSLICLVHGCTDCLLQVIPNIPLGHCAAFRQINLWDRCIFIMGKCKCLLNHSDLGTITVRDNDLVSLLDNSQDRGGSLPHAFNLLFWSIS